MVRLEGRSTHGAGDAATLKRSALARKWKSFLESEDERIALDACKYLTDRLFGKAPQSVSLDHSGSIDLAGELAAARERAKSPPSSESSRMLQAFVLTR